MANDQIGFIGLGSMGSAIAERYAQAKGVDLTVCDINPERIARFRALGAAVAGTPRELADRCDIVMACLPTVAASLDVALGPDGVTHGKRASVYIETSTIGPKSARAIAAGLTDPTGFLDAPISGGPPGAREGTLSTMVSGARKDFTRASDALAIMASSVFYIGEQPGAAQTAKLINNHLSTAGRLAAFEGFVMALKAGLDPRVLLDVVNKSSGRNYTTTHKIEAAILSGTFKFNGQLGISIKDEGLLLEEAEELGVQLWVAPRLLETLQEAAAGGYLEKDSTLVMQYMGEQAGIDVRAIMIGADSADKAAAPAGTPVAQPQE